MARSVTFDTLHPDNLAFLMIATALALHFSIAARIVPPATIWALVAVGILSAAQQAELGRCRAVLAGRTGSRRRRVGPPRARRVRALAVGTSCSSSRCRTTFRAWTVLVPAAQPYEFWFSRIAECLKNITSWQATSASRSSRRRSRSASSCGAADGEPPRRRRRFACGGHRRIPRATSRRWGSGTI